MVTEAAREGRSCGQAWCGDTALVPESQIPGLALPNWFRDLGRVLDPSQSCSGLICKMGLLVNWLSHNFKQEIEKSTTTQI